MAGRHLVHGRPSVSRCYLFYERVLSRLNPAVAASSFFQLTPLLRIERLPKEQAKRLLEEPAETPNVRSRPQIPSMSSSRLAPILICSSAPVPALKYPQRPGAAYRSCSFATAQRAMLDGHLQVHCQRTFSCIGNTWSPMNARCFRTRDAGEAPSASTRRRGPLPGPHSRRWACYNLAPKQGAYEFVSPLFRAFVAHRSESPAAVLEPSLTGLETPAVSVLASAPKSALHVLRNLLHTCGSTPGKQRMKESSAVEYRSQLHDSEERLKRVLERTFKH